MADDTRHDHIEILDRLAEAKRAWAGPVYGQRPAAADTTDMAIKRGFENYREALIARGTREKGA